MNSLNADLCRAGQPALKEKYGSKLAFWGTVGTASGCMYESPSAIASEAKERIETLGRGAVL